MSRIYLAEKSDVDNLKEDIVDLKNYGYVDVYTENIFNKETAKDAFAYNSIGKMTSNSTMCVSDYIEVKPNTSYVTSQGGRITLFKQDKTLAVVFNIAPANGQNLVFITGEDVAFVRLTCSIKSKKSRMLLEGTELPSVYIAHMHKHSSDLISQVNIANVKEFGAVGDGETDDTNAIQEALSSGLPYVYFPPGNYLVTKTITATTNYQIIYGEPGGKIPRSSIRVPNGTASAYNGSDLLLVNAREVHIRYLNFCQSNTSTGTTGVNCIHFKYQSSLANSDCSVSNCRFYQMGIAVKSCGRGLNFYQNQLYLMRTSGVNLYMLNTPSDKVDPIIYPPYDGRGVRIHDNLCHCESTGFVFVDIKNKTESPNTHWYGLMIYNNQLHYRAALLECNGILDSATISNNSTVAFLNFGIPCVRITKAINTVISSNVFVGTKTLEEIKEEFPEYTYTVFEQPNTLIEIDNSKGVKIQNNVFAECKKECIVIDEMQYGTICGNTFNNVSNDANIIISYTNMSNSVIAENVVYNKIKGKLLIENNSTCIICNNIVD